MIHRKGAKNAKNDRKPYSLLCALRAFAVEKALPLLANTLWFLSALPDALAWRRATRHVTATQTALLTRILTHNAKTEYLRHHTPTPHSPIPNPPLTTYADLAPFITRMADGEPNLLTADLVLLFEPTSGSSAATKLIPYTAALKRDFQRGIAPWIVHTFAAHPGLFTGRAYWSVTPLTAQDRRTAAGIPIGFEEESSYLGGWAGLLVDAVMAVPSPVKLIPDMASFRYVTLRFLLACPDLALISIWNPTFLTLLVDPLGEWADMLIADIRHGTITPPGPIPPAVHARLTRTLRPDPRRADQIQAILSTHADASTRHRLLWPNLRLISCWADANAAPYAVQLARLFPHAQIQPKGLLSTEAFVSLPLPLPNLQGGGSALALTSHFFEFLACTGDEIRLAHELQIGRDYEVIVTTGGGLYRYRTGDRVRVIGRINQCPTVQFMGRIGAVVDWFGEKLHEEHVGRVIQTALAERGWTPLFVMLACDIDLSPPAYVLYIQTEEKRSDEALSALGDEIETGLLANFHYAYARQLGQLGPMQIFPIRSGGLDSYMAGCMAHGQRAGDIKPTILHRRSGWGAWFN